MSSQSAHHEWSGGTHHSKWYATFYVRARSSITSCVRHDFGKYDQTGSALRLSQNYQYQPQNRWTFERNTGRAKTCLVDIGCTREVRISQAIDYFGTNTTPSESIHCNPWTTMHHSQHHVQNSQITFQVLGPRRKMQMAHARSVVWSAMKQATQMYNFNSPIRSEKVFNQHFFCQKVFSISTILD